MSTTANARFDDLIMALGYVEVVGIRRKIQNGQKLCRYERKTLKWWDRSAVTEAEEAKYDRMCKAILRRSKFHFVKAELP